jgi:cobalt/nickel transport system ATP-binding protein
MIKVRHTVFELENITHIYPDGTLALQDVSLKVYEKEKVAVLGPNGAGKSTLLMIMDGLIKPTKGTVRFLGEEVKFNDDKFLYEMRKKVGLVFQDSDAALFSSTIWEDVIFGPLHMGLPKEEVIRRGEAALQLLGIEHLKDKPPFQLSEGEKRKAVIASVLSINPEILLLDEPLINLDAATQTMIVNLLESMHKEGKTIVTATHDINVVPLIADRIIVLNKTVIGEGSIEEVFSNVDLMKKANLHPPVITELFVKLKEYGISEPSTKIPLTVNEAINYILKLLNGTSKNVKNGKKEQT